MIDHLLEIYNTSDAGFAYFYFDYRSRDLQTPNMFLATILRQLLSQRNGLTRPLIDLYGRCKKDRSQVTSADLLQMCREIKTAFKNCFVFIDALDESDGKRHRKEILDILEALEVVKFKIVITSRPHPQDVKRHFRNAKQIQVTASEADIRSFCLSRIEGNEDIRDLVDDQLQEDILLTMSTNAQGMYVLKHDWI